MPRLAGCGAGWQARVGRCAQERQPPAWKTRPPSFMLRLWSQRAQAAALAGRHHGLQLEPPLPAAATALRLGALAGGS